MITIHVLHAYFSLYMYKILHTFLCEVLYMLMVTPDQIISLLMIKVLSLAHLSLATLNQISILTLLKKKVNIAAVMMKSKRTLRTTVKVNCPD